MSGLRQWPSYRQIDGPFCRNFIGQAAGATISGTKSRVDALASAGSTRRNKPGGHLWRNNGCCALIRYLPSLAGAVVFIALNAPPALAAPVDHSCHAGAPGLPAASDWNGRRMEMRHLTNWQSFRDSVPWRLTPGGILTDRGPVRVEPRERYRVERVAEAWRKYGSLIRAAARRYRVPAELFLAIVINESSLDPKAFQKYRGYVSDRETPDRISVGLGAILIGTAQFMLKNPSIDRAWLQNPANNIRMVGLYLHRQYRLTGFDPPKVAAAYNAGGLYRQNGRKNRWKLRNHPLGHSVYIDLFVAVFDASMRFLANRPDRPRESFASLFAWDSIAAACVRIPDFRSGNPIARAVVRQPLAHEIGSDVVLAGDRARSGVEVGNGADRMHGSEDFLTRLTRHQRARISLQSRIPGRVPDDPGFRTVSASTGVR